MNTIYNEDVYFDELRKFYADLKRIAVASAVLSGLDLRGVPRGSVMFSSPVKRYTAKDGSVTEYQYTNPFLYIEGKKYYISKKHPHPLGACKMDSDAAEGMCYTFCMFLPLWG